MEISDSKKYSMIFGGALIGAGLVIATVVFPFWNLIRDDVFEEVKILANDNGICYVETKDRIPKTIDNCNEESGNTVTIKFGEGLAWAKIIEPTK